MMKLNDSKINDEVGWFYTKWWSSMILHWMMKLNDSKLDDEVKWF